MAQFFGYAGINLGSPTLSTAMLNLIPAFTFILAVIFRSYPSLIYSHCKLWPPSMITYFTFAFNGLKNPCFSFILNYDLP